MTEVIEKDDLIKQEILQIINLIKTTNNKEELKRIYRVFVYKKYIRDSLSLEDEDKYYEHLAQPEEIDPVKIQPRLVVA
ncbi:MAG: hypothetical protein ACP5IE_06520, partial [Infirmifilum sp.]